MMRMGILILLASAALPLAAQQKPFDYHSNAELTQTQQQLMAKAVSTESGSANTRIAEYGDHAISVAARVKPGGPEVHEHWADVILVTEGGATLLIGGTVVKPVPRGAPGSGEMGGSDIVGATTQVVKKGDIINIPAGTPHWIKMEPGDTFSYVNVKIRKE